jgi:hypothetical protein
MKKRNLVRIVCLLTAAGTMSGLMKAAPQEFESSAVTVQPEGKYFEGDASALLREIRVTANQLAVDADLLESFTRGELSRQSHAYQVNRVKDHTNAIGEQLARIETIRPLMAPWQQRAADAIAPAAAKLAASVGEAIRHLNEGGNALWHPDYAEQLRTIAGHSERVKDTVGLHLAMADAADRLEELTDRASELGS